LFETSETEKSMQLTCCNTNSISVCIYDLHLAWQWHGARLVKAPLDARDRIQWKFEPHTIVPNGAQCTRAIDFSNPIGAPVSFHRTNIHRCPHTTNDSPLLKSWLCICMWSQCVGHQIRQRVNVLDGPARPRQPLRQFSTS